MRSIALIVSDYVRSEALMEPELFSLRLAVSRTYVPSAARAGGYTAYFRSSVADLLKNYQPVWMDMHNLIQRVAAAGRLNQSITRDQHNNKSPAWHSANIAVTIVIGVLRTRMATPASFSGVSVADRTSAAAELLGIIIPGVDAPLEAVRAASQLLPLSRQQRVKSKVESEADLAKWVFPSGPAMLDKGRAAGVSEEDVNIILDKYGVSSPKKRARCSRYKVILGCLKYACKVQAEDVGGRLATAIDISSGDPGAAAYAERLRNNIAASAAPMGPGIIDSIDTLHAVASRADIKKALLSLETAALVAIAKYT